MYSYWNHDILHLFYFLSEGFETRVDILESKVMTYEFQDHVPFWLEYDLTETDESRIWIPDHIGFKKDEWCRSLLFSDLCTN